MHAPSFGTWGSQVQILPLRPTLSPNLLFSANGSADAWRDQRKTGLRLVETEQIPTHRERVAGAGAARPPGLAWTVAMTNLWARKSIAALRAEAEERDVQALTTHGGIPLKRTLSATSLSPIRSRSASMPSA